MAEHIKYQEDIHDLIDSADTITRILNGKIPDEDFELLLDTLDEMIDLEMRIRKEPEKYYSSWFD